MTDLTDRMRTCAAYLEAESKPISLTTGFMTACGDAIALLREVANMLEQPPPVAETLTPWPLIEAPPAPPLKPKPPAPAHFEATWVDPGVPDLPRVEPKGCPSCGVVMAMKVIRPPMSKVYHLECPRCAHTWPMRKRAG